MPAPSNSTTRNVTSSMGSCRGKDSQLSLPKMVRLRVSVTMLMLRCRVILHSGVMHHLAGAGRSRLHATFQNAAVEIGIDAGITDNRNTLGRFGQVPVKGERERL